MPKRRREVSATRFLKVGILAMPLALVAALGGALVVDRIERRGQARAPCGHRNAGMADPRAVPPAGFRDLPAVTGFHARILGIPQGQDARAPERPGAVPWGDRGIPSGHPRTSLDRSCMFTRTLMRVLRIG